jgi:hypothetical protein
MAALRLTLLGAFISLSGCSWLLGIDLRVISPTQNDFVYLLAASATRAGFEQRSRDCDSIREDREVAYCATYQSKNNDAPLRLVARMRDGVQSISALRLNDGLASDEKHALITLVKSLRDGGAELCLNENLPGSGLPRSLKAWLKGNCS